MAPLLLLLPIARSIDDDDDDDAAADELSYFMHECMYVCMYVVFTILSYDDALSFYFLGRSPSVL